MCRTPSRCFTIKKIEILIKCWTRIYPIDFWWWIMTIWCHVSYILTSHWSILLCYQAPSIRLTNDPIINVWLDHYFTPDVLPKTVIDSASCSFTEWRGGWNRNIGCWSIPVWTGSDGVVVWTKVVVVGECVTVNQSPPTSMCFHITVNFESWWTSIRPDPVHSWARGWSRSLDI